MSQLNQIAAIADEAARAHSKYGSFVSTHEGYGVLAEELAELLDAIRSNDRNAVRAEAIQVAAVALRIAESVAWGSSEFLARSGIGCDTLKARRVEI